MAKLAREVEQALQQARARWPQIELSNACFEAQIEELAIPAERILDRADDLFLAVACAEGNAKALAQFESLIVAGAQTSVRRYGNDDFVDEVIQRLRVSLLVGESEASARIARYDGRASLRAWVGICAVRMALYLLRGQRNRREFSADWSSAVFAISTGDATLDGLKQQYASAFQDALRLASGQLSPRQRTLMRLRFSHGVTVDEIAATYVVHRVTAWRWLQGAQEALLANVITQLKLAIPNDEIGLNSLMQLVESQIAFSMTSLFEEAV